MMEIQRIGDWMEAEDSTSHKVSEIVMDLLLCWNPNIESGF